MIFPNWENSHLSKTQLGKILLIFKAKRIWLIVFFLLCKVVNKTKMARQVKKKRTEKPAEEDTSDSSSESEGEEEQQLVRRRKEPEKPVEQAAEPEQPVQQKSFAGAATKRAPNSLATVAAGSKNDTASGVKTKSLLPDLSFFEKKEEFREIVQALYRRWEFSGVIPKDDWARTVGFPDGWKLKMVAASKGSRYLGNFKVAFVGPKSTQKLDSKIYEKLYSVITPPLPIESFIGGIGMGGDLTKKNERVYPHKNKHYIAYVCSGKFYPEELQNLLYPEMAKMFWHATRETCIRFLEQMYDKPDVYPDIKATWKEKEIKDLIEKNGGEDRDKNGVLIDENHPVVIANTKKKFIDGGKMMATTATCLNEEGVEEIMPIIKISKNAFKYNSPSGKSTDAAPILTEKDYVTFGKDYEWYYNMNNCNEIIEIMKKLNYTFERWRITNGQGQLITHVPYEGKKTPVDKLPVTVNLVWPGCIARNVFFFFPYACEASDEKDMKYGVRGYVLRASGGKQEHLQLIYKQAERQKSGAVMGAVFGAQNEEDLINTNKDGEFDDFTEYLNDETKEIAEGTAPPTAS